MVRTAGLICCGAALAASLGFSTAQAAPPAQAKAAPKAAGKSAKPPSVRPTGTLDEMDLFALMTKELAHPAAIDPFTGPAHNPYEGRRFRVSSPVYQRGTFTLNSSGRWAYDPDEHEFTLSVEEPFSIVYKETTVGSFVGSNAFGAKTLVKRVLGTGMSLDAQSQPDEQSSYSKSISAPPEEARRLSDVAWIVLEGTIASSPAGGAVVCTDHTDTATRDDPVELETLNCAVQVKIDRISFIDRLKKNAVLAEWRGPTEAAPIAVTSVKPADIKTATPKAALVFTGEEQEFERRPTDAEIKAFYPERALRMEKTGRAILTCDAQADGSLRACKAVNEAPEDFGFGDAALKISALFKLKPSAVPQGGAIVSIPIFFSLQ